MNIKDRLTPALDCLTNPTVMPLKPEHRRARLLAWILLFIISSSIAWLLILLIFQPHHDPARGQYIVFIISLVVFFIIAYVLNCAGYYKISAMLLVGSAVAIPWVPLLLDSSILQGDFVLLTYITFSVLLSSVLLPIQVTIILAIFQFAGLILTALCSSL